MDHYKNFMELKKKRTKNYLRFRIKNREVNIENFYNIINHAHNTEIITIIKNEKDM